MLVKSEEFGTLIFWWACKISGATMKNALTFPLKSNNRDIILPCYSMPKYRPKGIENICLHKNLYNNVHSDISLISKCMSHPNIHQLMKG